MLKIIAAREPNEEALTAWEGEGGRVSAAGTE